jgi:hypothetical protein
MSTTTPVIAAGRLTAPVARDQEEVGTASCQRAEKGTPERLRGALPRAPKFQTWCVAASSESGHGGLLQAPSLALLVLEGG